MCVCVCVCVVCVCVCGVCVCVCVVCVCFFSPFFFFFFFFFRTAPKPLKIHRGTVRCSSAGLPSLEFAARLPQDREGQGHE